MSGNHFEPRAKDFGTRPASPLSLSLTVHRVVREDVRIPLGAEFRFDPGSPLLVTVVFRPKDGPDVTWHLGRDLLCEGLLEAGGLGDVRVWPERARGRAVLRLMLAARGASALFEIDRRALEEWLFDTWDLVPPGTELDGVDWDALLDGLLDGR
ncbi:SsgA family sporulation/cell division regulator [Streptomyces sp. NPDC026672]|uniref:SsgA family sporulation/cell division regulator n=1 Tax=unclassified Streptomyces TaxID=2593676 RepID=UPI0033C045F2